MHTENERALAQQALIEKGDAVVATFAVDPPKRHLRAIGVQFGMVAATLLLFLAVFGLNTPILGFFIGAALTSGLVSFLVWCGLTLPWAKTPPAPLVLTERAVIDTYARHLPLDQIDKVALKGATLRISAKSPRAALSAPNLIAPNSALTALKAAQTS